MEIVLSGVWEQRLKTMADARGQTEEEIVEEALTMLYFMIGRDELSEQTSTASTS
jgi:hypothetical protein